MRKKKIINPFLNEKQLKGKLFQLRQKAYKWNFPCYSRECNKQAIESHILQKNGVLGHISEKQHLMTLKNNFFTRDYAFERIGINNIFTFKGFCNFHDSEIFTPIESGDFSLTDYKNQLLLSYRGLLNELRKKEILIKYYNSIMQDDELSYYMNDDGLHRVIQNHSLAINDISTFKNLFELDIEGRSQNFRFIVREIDRIPVCTSSIFSFETNDDMLSKFGTFEFLRPLDVIFLNVLPQATKSYIVIGTKNSCQLDCQVYLERFSVLSVEKLKKEISDILFRNIETWVCSESFYKSNIIHHKEYIKSFKKETSFEHGTDITVDINIFEEKR